MNVYIVYLGYLRLCVGWDAICIDKKCCFLVDTTLRIYIKVVDFFLGIV